MKLTTHPIAIYRSSSDTSAASFHGNDAIGRTYGHSDAVSSLNAALDALSLRELVDLLPIGITVEEGDTGAYLLVNAYADTFLGEFSAHPPEADCTADIAPHGASTGFSEIGSEEISTSGHQGRTFLKLTKAGTFNGEPAVASAYLDITSRKQIENDLVRRADIDELTGLPSRLLIERHIQKLIASPNDRFAVAFIDVDDFKKVNDYYGHLIGDALLVQLARRIAGAISKLDVLARISGDEFLLLIPNVADGAALDASIDQIIDAIKHPFVIDTFEICVSVSIGVSLYPDHGANYVTLRQNADSAMYQVKRGTKGAAALFNSTIEQSSSERIRTEQQLRLAIRDRRFRCAFQPKVNLVSGDVVGVEALIRLLDENGDVQKPSKFVDLAIELNLVDELTYLALADILASLDQINDAFGPASPISFNIAARQASNVDFMHSIVETLRSTTCAKRFVIEVTEDAFVSRGPFQAVVLPMLRQAGLRVSIDDFGVGYSSLSALADMTADELKIDRSFITNIHERKRSQNILKAIESLACALDMTIIAEGVETIEELTYLRTMTQIKTVQGFYYSKPILLEDSDTLSPRRGSRSRATAPRRETSQTRSAQGRSRR